MASFTLVLLALLVLSVTSQPVVLEKLSQVYLPFEFSENGDPVFCLGEAAAEQITFDSNAALLYVSGNQQLRVLDLSDPANPVVIATQSVPGEITDVAYCGNYVAASVPSDPESLPGRVFIYSSYSEGDGLELQYEVEVGALPDSIVFTKDCGRLIAGNEGEAGVNRRGEFTNPEGSVTIIDMEALEQGEEATQTVDFTSFNDDPTSAMDAGVRWIWRGQGLRPAMRDRKSVV